MIGFFAEVERVRRLRRRAGPLLRDLFQLRENAGRCVGGDGELALPGLIPRGADFDNVLSCSEPVFRQRGGPTNFPSTYTCPQGLPSPNAGAALLGDTCARRSIRAPIVISRMLSAAM
jgi:hypothetical protein